MGVSLLKQSQNHNSHSFPPDLYIKTVSRNYTEATPKGKKAFYCRFESLFHDAP